MNTSVSHSIAILLREKGFNKSCINKYIGDQLIELNGNIVNSTDVLVMEAPTIAEVVMWLYEKHGIWVYVKPVLDEDGEWIFKGYVKHMTNHKANEYQIKQLRQPTEAYEAAISYTLNNLI